MTDTTNKNTHTETERFRETEKWKLESIGWHDFSVMLSNNPIFFLQVSEF